MGMLFSNYQVKNIILKNRIVMSPMCMYASSEKDGRVTEFHKIHYASRAFGQVGLIFLESTSVDPQGRISVFDLGIWDNLHVQGLKSIVDAVHNGGSKIGIQLSHAGRKAIVEGSVYAPSSIRYKEGMKLPIEMSYEDIKRTINDFKNGAIRSQEAGFDVIEIHAAHGYLINQFLSPLSNKRTDEYGGSRENRFRFLKEIIEEINSIWNGPLFVRISASEYHPEGNKIEDFIYYAQMMKELGVDLIDCSSGAVVPAKIDVFPGYQVKFAEKIKREVNIDTGAVGLITNALLAEEILNNKRGDLIFIARELLRDPYWPLRAAVQLKENIDFPNSYEKAWTEILPINNNAIYQRWYPGKES
ncbi:NADPH dehydrogenase NamA [Ureibacillus massiliensis]|uniref:NADPH dehydrogenase NamA n=1 Tax=Ureibacillus massiliensis TaxID=292806 RepID=UPI000A8A9E8A|nr:NADPH dehydrogenase NamA [Ureibacillus massiliensis]